MELKRELKSCLRHTCKVVELSFFLGLLSITVFFAKDVWKEYISNSTSVKTQFEAKEALDLPVIVMCFNPSIKQSVKINTIHQYQVSTMNLTQQFTMREHITLESILTSLFIQVQTCQNK